MDTTEDTTGTPEDREIQDAYGRLGTALAPPPDVAVRVGRLVTVRRRRRRTALVGVAGLVVAGSVGGAVLLRSGEDGKGEDAVATDTSSTSPHGSFVLTRSDGSIYEFDDLTLSCAGTGPNGENVAPGHIVMFSPFQPDPSGKVLTEPFLYFDGVVDKIDGRSFRLPFESDSGSSDDRAFVLFAADGETPRTKHPNEVSSAEAGAAGTVHVLHASCGPTPVLDLEVDATLGSEVQQGTLDLKGSFG